MNTAPYLKVTAGTSASDRQDFRFDQTFRIGRTEDCEVCIQNQFVSRAHVEVVLDGGVWRVRDLGSSNGIFVDGQRVSESLTIGEKLVLRLGVEGPFVLLQVEAPPPPPPPTPPAGSAPSKTVIAQRYFGELKGDEVLGDRTILIRQAFAQVQKKQRWKYGWIVGSVAAVALALGGFAIFQHKQLSQRQALAQELFYAMKSLDVDIANVQKLVEDANSAQGQEQIRKYQTKRREMEQSYERFLKTLKVYDSKLTEQERLLLRVTRIFGECELAMPPEFKSEVESYIKKWQSSGRLAKAIARAKEGGYGPRIASELLARNLPPQFFYLALQESDFDAFISGPPTYKGIAKGMWQFIPETGMKYGLKIGPLAEFRRPDTNDDRHHWEKATGAAARYLRDLYSTDALASGLLVMASYNWGEERVIRLIRSLPANTRERNFWALLKKYRDQLPQETYDYVFYIVSATVIGENPKLFGFQFENPLAAVENQ